MVLDFFGKRISESGKATHAHTHREIGTFDVAGADVAGIGSANDADAVTCYTLWRAVASLPFRILRVHFNQLSVVNLFTECVDHGPEISLKSIRCELHAICETTGHVSHKRPCCFPVALSEAPARNEFRVSVNRGPRPNVTG